MDASRRTQLLLVQDLVDGRLDGAAAAEVQKLIDGDKDLGDAAAFFRWLSGALPEAVAAPPVSPTLQRLLADLAADSIDTEAGAEG